MFESAYVHDDQVLGEKLNRIKEREESGLGLHVKSKKLNWKTEDTVLVSLETSLSSSPVVSIKKGFSVYSFIYYPFNRPNDFRGIKKESFTSPFIFVYLV